MDHVFLEDKGDLVCFRDEENEGWGTEIYRLCSINLPEWMV
jgi:hypothetical protein